MSGASSGCPGSGVLLRLLDGELEPDEAAAVRAHLDRCPACADRLRALRRRDRAVSRWIADHDPEPPPREAYDLTPRHSRARRWGPARWVAAAAVVILAGTLVSPLRGFLVEPVLEEVRSWLGAAPPGSSGADDPAEAGRRTGPGSAATAFAPGGSVLTLSFPSSDVRGTLTVERAADSLVTLRSADPGVSLTIGPRGVDVGGTGEVAMRLRVALPPTVSTLRIRIPGAEDAVVPVDSLEEALRIPLPRPSPSGGTSP